MDMNHNYSQNLDGSMNLNGSGVLNASGNFTGIYPAMDNNAQNVQSLQNLTPQQLYQLQLINQQQIQQLSNQIAQVQMPVGNATPISTMSPVSPVSPTHIPVGQYYVPPTMTTAASGIHSPLNMSFNGDFQTMAVTNPQMVPANNLVAYPNPPTRINVHNQSLDHGFNNSAGHVNISGPDRNVTTPNSLPLKTTNAPRHNGYPSSNYSSSTASTPQDSPAMPKREGVSQDGNGSDVSDAPVFMQRPRQQISSPPGATPQAMSDRSSTSSASVPGSPISLGTPAFSPDGNWSDASGPRSPDYSPRKGSLNDAKSIKSIQNKPLQIKTRYPQDKCYTCMKKVYPMEKHGPVRGVVYHKLCFKCKVCMTQLNLKNFFHNQSDSYDIAVYCKSHQPVSKDKAPKLDSESFEIKSALTAPKKGPVTPESERVPVRNYNYNSNSREIEHARKVPVADLQRGTKMRYHAWSKSKRQNDSKIEQNEDIVRHDEPVPEYDPESYTMHQVENSPDYG